MASICIHCQSVRGLRIHPPDQLQEATWSPLALPQKSSADVALTWQTKVPLSRAIRRDPLLEGQVVSVSRSRANFGAVRACRRIPDGGNSGGLMSKYDKKGDTWHSRKQASVGIVGGVRGGCSRSGRGGAVDAGGGIRTGSARLYSKTRFGGKFCEGSVSAHLLAVEDEPSCRYGLCTDSEGRRRRRRRRRRGRWGDAGAARGRVRRYQMREMSVAARLGGGGCFAIKPPRTTVFIPRMTTMMGTPLSMGVDIGRYAKGGRRRRREGQRGESGGWRRSGSKSKLSLERMMVRAFDFNDDGEDNEIDLDEDEDPTEAEKFGSPHYEVPLADYGASDADGPLFEDAPVGYKIDEKKFHKLSLHQCDFFIRKGTLMDDDDEDEDEEEEEEEEDNGESVDDEGNEEEEVEEGEEEVEGEKKRVKKKRRNDVYDLSGCYVTPPDTDVYTIARTVGKISKKPVRCTRSNWEVITYKLPPQDTPRAPYITTKYEVHKVFLIKHLENRKREDKDFVLDFEEVYVLDGKKRTIERANVVVEVLPKGRKRDRSKEVFCVREDSYRLVPVEEAKTRDEIVIERKGERAEQQLEEYLKGFRDYDESAKF